MIILASSFRCNEHLSGRFNECDTSRFNLQPSRRHGSESSASRQRADLDTFIQKSPAANGGGSGAKAIKGTSYTGIMAVSPIAIPL